MANYTYRSWNRIKCGYCGTHFWGSFPDSYRPCSQCYSFKREWVHKVPRRFKVAGEC